MDSHKLHVCHGMASTKRCASLQRTTECNYATAVHSAHSRCLSSCQQAESKPGDPCCLLLLGRAQPISPGLSGRRGQQRWEPCGEQQRHCSSCHVCRHSTHQWHPQGLLQHPPPPPGSPGPAPAFLPFLPLHLPAPCPDTFACWTDC